MMPATSQKELLEIALQELSYIKNRLPNGELKALTEDMKEVREDISELKRTLLNPEDGVIVKTNKNTEFRVEKEKKFRDYDEKFQSLNEILKWKEGVTRALWIIFTALVGLLVTIVTKQ